MANANLSKIDLITPTAFKNGEKANAEVLNRPIKQIHDNIVNQKNVLDSVVDLLASNNLELDEFQEIVNYIENTRGAIGRISSPLLDLPLKNSLSMKSGVGSVTFSRSTTATYIDRYGVLKTAGIDEPRFEKDGLLIEGKSTNVHLYSNDLSAYEQNGNCSATQDQKSPTGDSSAINVVGATTHTNSSGKDNLRGYGITTAASTKYTFSIFVKATTYVKVRFAVSTNNYQYTQPHSGNGKWERLSVTFTTASNGTYGRFICGNDQDTSDFQIYGAQLEKLPFASSYIPTTNTFATRSCDICDIDVYNNFPNLEKVEKGLSILCDSKFQTNDNYRYIWGLYTNSTDAIGVHYYKGKYASRCVSASEKNDIYTGYLIGLKSERVALIINSNEHSFFINGKKVASSPKKTDTITETQNTTAKFRLGTYNTSHVPESGEMLHIKNFRVYNVALTEAEVKLA